MVMSGLERVYPVLPPGGDFSEEVFEEWLQAEGEDLKLLVLPKDWCFQLVEYRFLLQHVTALAGHHCFLVQPLRG